MTLRKIVRAITAVLFIGIGITHFRRPNVFARIVPPALPHSLLLVQISGACEIAGGIGLLIPKLRRPAAWGLIALLIAVFPANVYMALAPDQFADWNMPAWVWWLRLPFQAMFIAMVSWSGLVKSEPSTEPSTAPGRAGPAGATRTGSEKPKC